MYMGNQLINKYQEKSRAKLVPFSQVPVDVLDSAISVEAKGLYCFIVYNSSMSPKYQGAFAMNGTTIDALRYLIKWDSSTASTTNRKQLREYLKELEDQNFIKIIKHGKCIDIVFNAAKSDKNIRFAKLYPETVRKIVDSTKGKTMLKRLVVYAQLRTLIFENSKDSRILDKSNNYLAKVLGMARSSVANHMQWMREHEVLAYFKCKMNRAIGYEKYYYADMVDCHVLTDIIKGYQKQGEVKEIVE